MNKWLTGLMILVVIIGGYFVFNAKKTVPVTAQAIKIGVITDLTGPAAYWGVSSQIGAQLAVQDLATEGIAVQPIFEDYQLDAAKAASAAQKLSSVDKVNAVYVEFNPGSISASSVFKGTNTLYLYDAAIESPLKDSPSNFKTYLDYRAGCQSVAQKFKDSGIKIVGMLKVNLEFGDLCLQGVQSVYGSNMMTDSYNLGDTDFRTQLTKFKSEKVGAIINVGFEGDTYNTLQGMRQLGIKVPYGTVDDTLTDKVKSAFAQELKGAWSFGFKDVDSNLVSRFVTANGGKQLGSNYAAALSYLHIKQLAHALASCNGDEQCAIGKMGQSPADGTIGFQGFVNRIAQLQMSVKQY